MDSQWWPIVVTLGIFFAGQLAIGIWWGSRITVRVDSMREQLTELARDLKALGRDAARITICERELVLIREQLERVEKRVDALHELVDGRRRGD